MTSTQIFGFIEQIAALKLAVCELVSVIRRLAIIQEQKHERDTHANRGI